jgi:hypothetical protein
MAPANDTGGPLLRFILFSVAGIPCNSCRLLILLEPDATDSYIFVYSRPGWTRRLR